MPPHSLSSGLDQETRPVLPSGLALRLVATRPAWQVLRSRGSGFPSQARPARAPTPSSASPSSSFPQGLSGWRGQAFCPYRLVLWWPSVAHHPHGHRVGQVPPGQQLEDCLCPPGALDAESTLGAQEP